MSSGGDLGREVLVEATATFHFGDTGWSLPLGPEYGASEAIWGEVAIVTLAAASGASGRRAHAESRPRQSSTLVEAADAKTPMDRG